jgi:hypothetical protein
VLRDARHSQGDSVRSALDCQPFCGESLQQQEKAGCTSTPYAIIGDQASPPADLFLSGQQSVVPRWPGKPRPPPISFDAGGGDRVKRQGAKFATCQHRMRQLVRSSLVTRDSWTRHFRQRLSHFSRDQEGTRGASHGVFRLRFAAPLFKRTDPSEPALRPRVSTTRRPQIHPHTIGIFHCPRPSIAAAAAAVHTRRTRLDSTRLDSTPPTREPRMIE